ncbi:Serine/arginine-rich splicing factor SR45a [Zea mays]|uniref:Serine/arginine-rich splicing factor SR45a n=1 Tax=Zea mays TaxID=4577 RepID=A0A1D6MGG3_MAIZE|nr:Serine/arginine-rich splicing factor SR45a [Zea mays]|eukprot:XP_008673207.1 uncharacterized protein LOC100383483 isoform X2 [Zea mays]
MYDSIFYVGTAYIYVGAAPTSAPGRRLGGTCTQGSSSDVVAVRRASAVACPAPPRMPARSVSRSTHTEWPVFKVVLILSSWLNETINVWMFIDLLGFMLFFDLTLVHLGQYFTKVSGMIGHLSCHCSLRPQLRRPSSNQGRLALAPRTHDPLLLYPQRRAPPSCFWQRKPSPCGKLPTRWNAQPLVGSTQPLRDVTNSGSQAG